MSKFRFIAPALTFGLIIPAAAHAEDGLYGAVSAGGVVLHDQSITAPPVNATVSYDAGFAILGAVGYGFGNNIRTEFELGYTSTGGDKIRSGATTTNIVGGDIDLYTLYAAAYYDFAVGDIKPYLGGGLGMAIADTDTFAVTGVTIPGGTSTDFSMFGETGAYYQASPQLAFGPSARYTWVDNGGGGVESNTGWLFKLGLRYDF